MKRTWYRERADGIEMRLRVHPGIHSNQVLGPYGDRLKLTLALHKSRLMAISRSFQSRQVMQQFLLDRLIG